MTLDELRLQKLSVKNESSSKTFHMKTILICMEINLWVEHISIRIVLKPRQTRPLDVNVQRVCGSRNDEVLTRLLKLINNSSSSNKGNHVRNSVWISDLN